MISLRALRDPSEAAMHLPWVRSVRERVRGLDLLPLLALVPPNGYIPDFLTPPPNTPLAKPRGQAQRDPLDPGGARAHGGGPTGGGRPRHSACRALPAPPAPIRRAARRLPLAAYWEVALEPHWARVRRSSADLMYRSRRLTEGGPTALFADLHPAIHWRDDGLEIRMVYSTTLPLDGRGLLLVPTVFPRTRPFAVASSYWQPTVMYPARGVALLWESGGEPPAEALAAVLGRGRGAVLLSLDAPRSTEVARRLDITPGGASRLSSLKAAGLVSSNRHGRSVLYAHSPLADELVGASEQRRLAAGLDSFSATAARTRRRAPPRRSARPRGGQWRAACCPRGL